MIGRIHSLQSLGAVDGPGVRCVVFMQGCPLRCIYCHNPDTWDKAGGFQIDTDELIDKILRFKPYFSGGGGVTVSGGEPLLQADFVAELFEKLHQQGVHTALDTSGIICDDKARQVLVHTDLALVDLKFLTAEEYKQNCGGNFDTVISFLKQTEKMEVPLWIRHVVTPNINDNLVYLQKVSDMAHEYKNLEKIEWLPFHNMCKEKYDEMGIAFPLDGTEAMQKETLDKLIACVV